METKLLEIRDEGTFIAVMATAMNPVRPELIQHMAPQWKEEIEAERYLLRRSGFEYERTAPYPKGKTYVFLQLLNKGKGTYNVFDWEHDGSRTRQVAHTYIIESWNSLRSGDVVDVQFIKGETKEPKKSERITGITADMMDAILT